MLEDETKRTFEDRDEFKRERIADSIIRLIQEENEKVKLFPMVVNGNWGSGKTEFCHKLKNKIQSDEKIKWQTIYIDSFKFDYTEDPLSVLISQIMSINSENKKEIIQKAIPILRTTGKIIGKSAISWILKQNADTISEDFAKALNETISPSIEQYLDDLEKVKSSIEDLQKYLTGIAAKRKNCHFY